MSGISVDRMATPSQTTSLTAYQSEDLAKLLESLRQEKTDGLLHLEVEIQPGVYWPRVFLWYQGEIAYGNDRQFDRVDLVRKLVRKFRPEYVTSITNWLSQQQDKGHSSRQLLGVLVQQKVLTWEQIESWTQSHTIYMLESAIGKPGKYRFAPMPGIDLYHGEQGEAGRGLNWNQLMLAVNTRQQYWSRLAPAIAGAYCIPQPLTAEAIARIPEPAIVQHAQKWFDGKRSISDIASEMERDPLQVVKSYAQWVQAGWLTCKSGNEEKDTGAGAPTNVTTSRELAIVLSVDDSPIVQTKIKRALTNHFEVLLANDAMSALHLLARQPVDLILLDVTMPGIDGIELCQTLRRMSKFAQLPIVMLTAKDKSYDRTLAEMVGATEYLTKPLDDDKLLAVVNKYTQSQLTVDNG
jgi:CheY-like chemotaxis protein